MRKMLVIAGKEWKTFFRTPFGLILLPVYYLLCGTYFYAKLDQYLQLAHPNETITEVKGLNAAQHLLTPFFQDLVTVFMLIVPLITMRTFAEEKKSCTYDLLLSYPLRPWEIVLGKYVGLLSLVFSIFATSLFYVGVVLWRGEPYLPQLVTAYLGMTLFLAFYVAVGVVASLLTENQLVAAVITYGIYLSAILLQWLAHISAAPWDKVFANFLLVAHLQSFHNGLVFFGDIIVYLATTIGILLYGVWRVRRHVFS